MGHESPERVPEQRAGHTPALDTRSIAAPAVENQTLDALAERAARNPDPAAASTLRPQAVQRLQLRAGNAAVAAMLQRKAAPTVRRAAPPVRKPPTAAPNLPVGRIASPGSTARTDAGAPVAETTTPETTTADRSTNVSTTGIGLAGSPPPSDGLPLQRSLASMIQEARRRAAPPAGPEDTKTVEGDTDLSEFTDAPAKAAEERQAIPPPPPPPKPAIPAALTGKVGDKPPPKPPKKKVGKALVAGPKGRPPKGGPGAKGAASPGEIVKKPAPPLPPTWKKPAAGKPVLDLPAAAAPVEELKPTQDPAFAKVVKAAGMTVKKARKHPTGKKESDSAQGAAVPPGNDIEAQAKAKRADTMATAKPKPFDEEMFVTAVKQELAKTAPKNLSEAGDVGKKAADAKGVIGDKVGASKEAAAGDVEKKSQEPPNPGDATPKPVTPMAPLEIEKPGGMKASGAMPAPVPNAAIDLREGPAKVDNEMGEAGVTEEQLAKSNEPEFTGALEAKKEGEQHSAEAPGEIRKAEGAVLKQASASAAAVEKQTVSQANSSITDAVGKIAGQKNQTKSKDELKRKEVSDKINSIFDKTKGDVDGILAGLDEKVDREFTAGEAQIRATFTADWQARLGAYKSDRYSGLRGKYRWVRDKFKGLPAKANQLFEVSRRLYEDAMDKLVRRLATIVTQELTRATVRIEQGRGEVAAYVSTLKGDLAKFGQEASEEITEKFGDLDSAVKDKFDDMASNLAKKYAESRDAVNNEIEAEKEKNKGLIDKAIGAVKAVIRVIGQLKDMVKTILAKIADVIGRIIADPIGFLKNFLAAVGRGISRFAENITEHLKGGLMGWLFGTLGAAGIDVPKEFSLEAILKLVLSVLGVTKDFILQRLEKKIGAPAMKALVDGAGIVKRVVTEGPGVLWEMIVEKFTEFQTMVVDSIKNFITEKVVKAGISWILGLLTPAGAFIKACQAIYSIIMFFVERGSELKEFVESIIDTAGAVARGESGGIPEKIEGVLAKLLPLAISFLANLVGIGGVGQKVRETIDKVQKPIGKAMDKVLDGILAVTAPVWKPIKKMYEGGKKLYGKAKEKAIAAYETGKAKVKAAGETVKDYAKRGVNKVKAGVAKVKEKVKQTAGKVVYKGQELYGKGKKKVVAAKDKVLAILKPQKKQTSMSGANHTLTAEPIKNGKFKVYMQSQKELLSAKLGRTIKQLETRAAGEAEPMKAKTLAQIAQLQEIAEVSKILESLHAEGKKVTSMGAPEGFETEMRLLSEKVKGFGDKNGVKDITAADAGTQVDMRLLARFGMPIPNYLQAQEIADQTGATIDIRATAVGAPELLAQGFSPKSEKFKQKTMNKDDELLGLPPELRDRVVWFLPSRPKPENFKDYPEDVLRAVWARWRQRKDEYYDNLAKMKKKLKEGQIALRPIGRASSGGVVDEQIKGVEGIVKSVGITGDHDVYRVSANAGAVLTALAKPPFRVQHGAHLDWPGAVREAEKRSLSPTEQRIFQAIVGKHLKGGEALLRINPHGPPTTSNSSKEDFKIGGGDVPPDLADDDIEVVDAKEPETAGAAEGAAKAPPGATPAEQVLVATKVVETFTTAGETHSLTVTFSADGTPDIVMASTPEAVQKKLLKACQAVSENPAHGRKRAAALAAVEKAQDTHASLKARILKWKQTIPANPSAKNLNTVTKSELVTLIHLIKELSAIPPKKGFDQLLKEAGTVEMIRSGVDIRAKLYGSSRWTSARDTCFNNQKPGAIANIRKPIDDYFAKSAGASATKKDQLKRQALNKLQALVDDDMLGKKTKAKIEKSLDRDVNPKLAEIDKDSYWQPDHHVPVAAHWSTTGNNTDDNERQDFYANVGNLKLISQEANSAAQAKHGGVSYQYARIVGPNFSTAKTNIFEP